MKPAEGVVERCHDALGSLVRGDAKPWTELFSRSEDVSLGNPFGPFAVGFDAVMDTARRAAERYSEGEIVGFERVATYEGTDLACVVEVERFRALVGDDP